MKNENIDLNTCVNAEREIYDNFMSMILGEKFEDNAVNTAYFYEYITFLMALNRINTEQFALLDSLTIIEKHGADFVETVIQYYSYLALCQINPLKSSISNFSIDDEKREEINLLLANLEHLHDISTVPNENNHHAPLFSLELFDEKATQSIDTANSIELYTSALSLLKSSFVDMNDDIYGHPHGEEGMRIRLSLLEKFGVFSKKFYEENGLFFCEETGLIFFSEKDTIFKLFHTYCNEAPVFAVIENKKIDLAELKEIEDFFGYMQLQFEQIWGEDNDAEWDVNFTYSEMLDLFCTFFGAKKIESTSSDYDYELDLYAMRESRCETQHREIFNTVFQDQINADDRIEKFFKDALLNPIRAKFSRNSLDSKYLDLIS